ncbi:MAG: PAS domain S-box protein [Desulfomonile tiedjei]|nr:PAS domain S-box protein [Desulfomonile tiedjei]
MKEKDLPKLDPSPNDSQEVPRVVSDPHPTETIDLDNLFGPHLTSSAGFDFTWIEQAAFGKLLEAIPVPALLVDASTRILFSNGALAKITGDSSQLRGRSFDSIFPDPDEASRAGSALTAIFVDRKPKYLEGTLTLMGTTIWGRVHLRSIRVREQRLILILVEDLTPERKELLLNEKYKNLVHLLPTGISEFAPELPVSPDLSEQQALNAILNAQLVEGNNEFARVNGAPAIENLIGARLQNLFPDEQETRRLLKKWINSGFAPQSAELVTELPDNRPRYTENTLIGVVKHGTLSGFWLLKRDITQSHRLREDAFRAQKLESLGVLASGIAHDFNNSLTAILGNLNLAKLRAAPEDPTLPRLVEAERACGRAKSLTEQLLTFAKGGPPVMKAGYIAPLLEECVGFALSGSNVACECSIPQDLWPVEFDEGQMSRVIHNLVLNAQQAMPEGGNLHVTAENVILAEGDVRGLDEGKYVRITTADSGVGIPRENLPKIFDPYFTTKKKGSGLGLATSYAIIKSHKGLIAVESELNVGTRFLIYLPAVDREISPRKALDRADCGAKGRVLVMEDEKMVRDVLEEMLNLMGYAVQCAAEGLEAIRCYKKAMEDGVRFDAVIMNLTVQGGMGGMEAIGELLTIDPHAKAIASSGLSSGPIMGDFAERGFKAVVSKPYNLDELTAVLGRVVQG